MKKISRRVVHVENGKRLQSSEFPEIRNQDIQVDVKIATAYTTENICKRSIPILRKESKGKFVVKHGGTKIVCGSEKEQEITRGKLGWNASWLMGEIPRNVLVAVNLTLSFSRLTILKTMVQKIEKIGRLLQLHTSFAEKATLQGIKSFVITAISRRPFMMYVPTNYQALSFKTR
jgi:hypothetical protein